MSREIKQIKHEISTKSSSKLGDPILWLQGQTENAGSGALLLAHADDGVIWGKVENGTLLTMPEETKLCAKTLQQARLFNANCEYYVWRDGDGAFHARIITDGKEETKVEQGEPQVEYFDEPQVLWGDRAEPAAHGFTKMSDGAQGLVHYVPIQVTKARANKRPLRLIVRHYLNKDENGFVRVAYSRLVALKEN